MPNKTIYVSEKDERLYEEAKQIAGEALSSVISLALGEYVAKHREKKKGMKEISLKVGKKDSEREVRFVGSYLGDWKGLSDDAIWFMRASIYRGQKGNWAVHLETVCKASLFTDKHAWKKSGDYLIDPRRSEVIVGKITAELKGKVPAELFARLSELSQKDEHPVEFLDI